MSEADDPDLVAGILTPLSPLIRRMIAPNAGPMTYTGTCTYIVGHGTVTVIDPGPDLPRHIEALTTALRGERIAQILVTHTHRDHSPGARLLAAATGAPILGCAPYRPARPPRDAEWPAVAASNDLDHAPDRVLGDNDRLSGDGYDLVAVTTPGHTMNHLAFALPQEGALFSGDHVMAWSTSVISPPTGSMAAYMQSLDKVASREDRIYWPGHGGPVKDPAKFVAALQRHRRQREQSILARLRISPTTADGLVEAAYQGLDSRLKRAARQSVLAHLESLEEAELVAAADDGVWRVLSSR
jgi:glyoxylase-like metal-dependent hydrolase (beta-lactamase superfamily II)